MLPARFELHRPETLNDALALLAQYGDEATAYAGGTELLVAMKARVLRYAHVVDLKRIADLRGVRRNADGTIVIGALSTHHELAHDATMRAHLPAYAELSDKVANIRVRVAGTLGGNLCFAEPHADPSTLLSALDASVVLVSESGRRSMLVEYFIEGEFTTARQDGELMLHVEIPPFAAETRAAYRSFGHLERPAAGVAAVCRQVAGETQWRFVVGAVCGRPTRLAALDDALAGIGAEDALAAIEQHAPAAVEALEAQDDLHGSADYKRHLVTVLARRAAEACLS